MSSLTSHTYCGFVSNGSFSSDATLAYSSPTSVPADFLEESFISGYYMEHSKMELLGPYLEFRIGVVSWPMGVRRGEGALRSVVCSLVFPARSALLC